MIAGYKSFLLYGNHFINLYYIQNLTSLDSLVEFENSINFMTYKAIKILL